jgi:hypothetical protein
MRPRRCSHASAVAAIFREFLGELTISAPPEDREVGPPKARARLERRRAA